MKTIEKILTHINRVVEYVCFVLLLVMTAVTFAQAVNRFVFKGAFFWAEECALWSMIWLTMLGSSVAMHRNSHTRIDFVLNALPSKLRKVVEILDLLVIAGFLAYLGWYSIPLIQKTLGIISSGLKLPRAIVFLAITTGCVFMIVDVIVMALRVLIDLVKEVQAS